MPIFPRLLWEAILCITDQCQSVHFQREDSLLRAHLRMSENVDLLRSCLLGSWRPAWGIHPARVKSQLCCQSQHIPSRWQKQLANRCSGSASCPLSILLWSPPIRDFLTKCCPSAASSLFLQIHLTGWPLLNLPIAWICYPQFYFSKHICSI